MYLLENNFCYLWSICTRIDDVNDSRWYFFFSFAFSFSLLVSSCHWWLYPCKLDVWKWWRRATALQSATAIIYAEPYMQYGERHNIFTVVCRHPIILTLCLGVHVLVLVSVCMCLGDNPKYCTNFRMWQTITCTRTYKRTYMEQMNENFVDWTHE